MCCSHNWTGDCSDDYNSVRRKYKVKEGEMEETHVYEEIPENFGTRAEIELQQNNAYGRNNKTTALFTEL